MGDDVMGGLGAFALDPTHVTFDVVHSGWPGFSAAQRKPAAPPVQWALSG
jgi:hypothetical protein